MSHMKISGSTNQPLPTKPLLKLYTIIEELWVNLGKHT